jgi:hypothetical protein
MIPNYYSEKLFGFSLESAKTLKQSAKTLQSSGPFVAAKVFQLGAKHPSLPTMGTMPSLFRLPPPLHSRAAPFCDPRLLRQLRASFLEA